MSEVTPTSAPMGGTELILANLKSALPDLCDKVQIMMSRPENYELEDKPRILWLQDLPQDPASAPLRDPSYRTRFSRIVFASYWQQQMYNAYLGIPYREGVVIRNGVPRMAPDWSLKARSIPCGADAQQCDAACQANHYKHKLRFIYTSTPHRGLALLAAAADELAKLRHDWELHVYSSFDIYGWHEQNKAYQPLYDRLQQNPHVVYHGSVPNTEVREAVRNAHVFVYPSIYAETSCMAIQEALMAGCLCITSSFGALIETCGDWAWMLQYTEDYNALASHTLRAMVHALEVYDDPGLQNMLHLQSQLYQQFWSFESRLPLWKQLLEAVIAEGTPVEKLIIG